MATKKIEMLYNLRQLNNENNNAHLLWFPKVVRRSTLNLRGLSDHISDHGSVYTRDVTMGVLTKFTSCLVELVQQGIAVKLDGLGTFSPSVDGQKQGKNSIEAAMAAGADAMINGIKINFTPENVKGEKLTSRAFKEQCIFEYGYVVQSEIRTVGGKQKRYQKKTPISYLMAPAPDNQGNG